MRHSSALPFILLLASTVFLDGLAYGQSQLGRPKFRVSSGQTLFTDFSQNVLDLEPYEKRSQEQLGEQLIDVIEQGNYRLKISEEGVDTLGYWVEEWRINGLDTQYRQSPIELRKTSSFALRGDVHFDEDRVTFILSDKQTSPGYFKTYGSSTKINADDENLYFKKEPGENFSVESTMGAFSLLTMPIKIRATGSADSLASTTEIGFNNLLVFVGVGNGWHQYEQGRMRNAIFNFGLFLGPTRVRLTPGNTDNAITEEIDRFGWSLGGAFLTNVRRFQFGLSVGADFLAGSPTYDWAHDGEIFFGFTLGYSFNRQFFD
ncbi:MAG: hypothetical protein AAGH79_10545 [Bacteroidota bacterium]